MTQPNPQDSRLLGWLMLAVLVWGGLLALGALLFGYDPQTGEITYAPNPVRGLIVLSCVLAFVGIWALLVTRRKRSGR